MERLEEEYGVEEEERDALAAKLQRKPADFKVLLCWPGYGVIILPSVCHRGLFLSPLRHPSTL